MIVYYNDRFLLKEAVCISPDDRGFLLADGAYEVIRAYGGRFFESHAHLQRLERSLKALRIAQPETARLRGIAEELLRRNDLGHGDAIVYIQVTRGTAPRRHAFPDQGTSPTVYLCASSVRSSPEKSERGVGIILVPDIRWLRCDIKSLALLPNVLANQEAKERGAEEAVFVRDGVITEGTHTNFCAVFDGQLVTHPRTNLILGGITRQVVLDLCRRLNIACLESPIHDRDLKKASELMIVSTTVEVLPVVQVDDWLVGDGKPGPTTRKLQQAFRAEIAAKCPPVEDVEA
jgi:D-alanine transaminase